MPRTLRGYIGLIVATSILIYALFVGRNYLRGLSLVVIEPKQNASLHEPLLMVSGVAHRTNHLSVNGVPTIPNRDGTWTHSLLLPLGYSIISIDATDRFNRTTHIDRAVYYRGIATVSNASSSEPTKN